MPTSKRRSHSRSTSTSKLAPFTAIQRDNSTGKLSDKKALVLTSSQPHPRLHRKSPPPPPADDEEEWESSESGIITPHPEPPPQSEPRPRPQSAILPSTLSHRRHDFPISHSTESLHLTSKRHSISARPSSSHGPPTRPHPLFRGLSHSGVASASSPLVTSDSVQALISPGPFSKSQPASPSHSTAQKQLRRTSISSVASAATLPVITIPDSRTRTLSTNSASHALHSLSTTASRPPTPPLSTLSVLFPPPTAVEDDIHILLPPFCKAAHATVVAFRNPILDSFERVIQAKMAQRAW